MTIAKKRAALFGFFTGLIVTVGNIAQAGQIQFDDAWAEQGFLRLWSNGYERNGSRLDITSEGTVSLLWREVPPGSRRSKKATWNWKVDQGVVPTDLTRKGGDDRSLALYFVFVDPVTAAELTPRQARRLLRNPNTRGLVYVWGGSHAVGAILPSPYHVGLRTKILRVDAVGAFQESVNLVHDYKAAFGEDPGLLVGLAISADSDDTGGRIRASVRNIELQ